MMTAQATQAAERLAPFALLLTDECRRDGRSGNQIAAAAAIDASYLSRLQRSDREPPRIEIIDRLAEALALPPQRWDALRMAAGHPPRILASADVMTNLALQAVARTLTTLRSERRVAFECAILALCRGFQVPAPAQQEGAA